MGRPCAEVGCPHAPPLRGSLPPEGADPALGRPGGGIGPAYEFQRLHGMGERLHDLLAKSHGVRSRIYAPVGRHADLLAYLAANRDTYWTDTFLNIMQYVEAN